MSTERLQEAAALMRSRAEAAPDCDHYASMTPDVALAVADWLEAELRRIDLAYDTYAWTGHPGLAVADAFLGGVS